MFRSGAALALQTFPPLLSFPWLFCLRSVGTALLALQARPGQTALLALQIHLQASGVSLKQSSKTVHPLVGNFGHIGSFRSLRSQGWASATSCPSEGLHSNAGLCWEFLLLVRHSKRSA